MKGHVSVSTCIHVFTIANQSYVSSVRQKIACLHTDSLHSTGNSPQVGRRQTLCCRLHLTTEATSWPHCQFCRCVLVCQLVKPLAVIWFGFKHCKHEACKGWDGASHTSWQLVCGRRPLRRREVSLFQSMQLCLCQFASQRQSQTSNPCCFGVPYTMGSYKGVSTRWGSGPPL